MKYCIMSLTKSRVTLINNKAEQDSLWQTIMCTFKMLKVYISLSLGPFFWLHITSLLVLLSGEDNCNSIFPWPSDQAIALLQLQCLLKLRSWFLFLQGSPKLNWCLTIYETEYIWINGGENRIILLNYSGGAVYPAQTENEECWDIPFDFKKRFFHVF